KTLGDDAFLEAQLELVIRREETNQISFPVENGNRIILSSLPDKTRWSTIYGMVTVISQVDENHISHHGGRHIFMLVDGESFVRKQGAARLSKVLLEN
ncbi:MAG TPA: hypothetical protein VFD16_02485, partial [Candidatus Saccharimonadales bacterium]|nr:hypothetical protein [Candidatus Saccharimonadales bacterium]